MIEVRITADTATEALKDLIELTRTMAVPTPSTPVSAPQTTAEPEPPKTTESPAPTVPVGKQNDETAEPTTAPALEDAAPNLVPDKPRKLTLEVIRAAGVEAARKYGKDTIKNILDAMGEVGMTSMSPDKYETFMRKLGELDA